jgi:hypothetical protein
MTLLRTVPQQVFKALFLARFHVVAVVVVGEATILDILGIRAERLNGARPQVTIGFDELGRRCVAEPQDVRSDEDLSIAAGA